MEPVEELIYRHFVKEKWSLCLAESCTGGLVAARLVKVPGASEYFLGSIVAYSNRSKETLLKVSSKVLSTHGAVSQEAAEEMAKGALAAFNSDFSIATTGIAGPSGGSPQKPVGLVCFAIASKDKIISWQTILTGDRTQIQESAATVALEKLFSQINH